MKKIFDYADAFLQQSIWKDMALLKSCLFSIGIMAGMQIPQEHKKKVGVAALAVFLATYIPLMRKFLGVVTEKDR